MTSNGRQAVTFGTNRFDWSAPARLVESARYTEAAGFGRLWFPDNQLHGGNVFLNVLTAAQATERAICGTLTVNPVTRHPTVLAGSIAAVDRYVPGRIALGIAVGDTAVWQIGARPARLAQLERAVVMIRRLLAGEGVDLGWTQPTRINNARPVPVIVAASGPKTLRMAGRSADGVVIRVGSDPELVAWGYEQVVAGAKEAGRDPAALFVAAHFHTVLADDPDLVAARAKVMAAGYYEVNRGLWEVLGVPWTLPPVEELLGVVRPDFHHAYDMDLAARLVQDIPLETALRFCIAGNGRECRAQIERLLARFPWIQHVILQPNMPGRAFVETAGKEIVAPLT
jgi:5,10-methylenetetrahydromethanopterin reductase